LDFLIPESSESGEPRPPPTPLNFLLLINHPYIYLITLYSRLSICVHGSLALGVALSPLDLAIYIGLFLRLIQGRI
jgi:hypothetical protein